MHEPVLYQEVIQALHPHADGCYVDGTVGAGGHAEGILETSAPGGQLLGLDVDPQALEIAKRRLAPFGPRVILVRASYSTLKTQLGELGWDSIDGVLLDLGLSSMQLESPDRGFSFRLDAPLDMRFDPQADLTAADLVNGMSEAELADLIYRYGEERKARQVARAIVGARPVRTTLELAKVVAQVTGGGRSRIHPATRTFQALRIATNNELGALEEFLPQAVQVLDREGSIAVIAYHSLEDRIVKKFIRQESRDCICPPQQPVCTCDHEATLLEITRKPIRPSREEVEANPRSRSARLRVAEKL